MKSFQFTGLMAPVFTPYTNQTETINYDAIEPYAVMLKKSNIQGILVNGTTGEGMLLNTAERMLVAEVWNRACKKLQMTIMVQIGGAPYPDVIKMAHHASEIDVDAVLCLPELYFKPKTCDKLVNYLKNVAKYCSSIPFFYYHIPMFTDVNLHMPTFLDAAELAINNFRGIKYTSGDLEQGSACLKPGRTIFLGADTILCGAIAAGFNSFIMTTINIYPEIVLDIISAMNDGSVSNARAKQRSLNECISSILEHGDWVTAMKKAFRERFPTIEVGHTRLPLGL